MVPDKHRPPVAGRRPKDPAKTGRQYRSVAQAYLTPEEYETVKQAAEIQRDTVSAFVADAALDRAHEILRIHNRTMELQRQAENKDKPRKR